MIKLYDFRDQMFSQRYKNNRDLIQDKFASVDIWAFFHKVDFVPVSNNTVCSTACVGHCPNDVRMFRLECGHFFHIPHLVDRNGNKPYSCPACNTQIRFFTGDFEKWIRTIELSGLLAIEQLLYDVEQVDRSFRSIVINERFPKTA